MSPQYSEIYLSAGDHYNQTAGASVWYTNTCTAFLATVPDDDDDDVSSASVNNKLTCNHLSSSALVTIQ